MTRPLTLALLAGSAMLLGCGTDSPVSAQRDIDSLYWTLTNDIKATTVALGGTQQIVAQPRNAYGVAVTGLPGATFRSVDATKVQVTPDGLVTGVALSSGTLVIATLTADGVTMADTSNVVVTAQSRVLGTFSIHPAVTDSAVVAMNAIKPIPISVKDTAGQTITGLAISYRSLNTNNATILGTLVRGVFSGTADVVASTTSYGITRVDTVRYKITFPNSATINVLDPPTNFNPGTVIVNVNATVNFFNTRETAVDVTFDDTTGIVNGNIPLLDSFSSVGRKFTVPGTYNYRNTMGTEKGTVVVKTN